jgi:hypothetical protein
MQYFQPEPPYFVGDCFPFYHDGVFRLFYLIDEDHHRGRDGLGGHQWAQASSTDLRQWEHQPLAIPLTEDWEGSICTGAVFHHEGTYYGFYATRMMDGTEHLSLATSDDGVHFTKTEPNPLLSPPPEYDPTAFRDPVVFADEAGWFHMLLTTRLTNAPLANLAGCLAHLTSDDLYNWTMEDPFFVPGFPDPPECPDHFEWNGHPYLLFSNDGVARYRTGDTPLGPWQNLGVDSLDGAMLRVIKTAPFKDNRRIGVGFLPTLEHGHDGDDWMYAGSAVFRELVQQDGFLGTKFSEELIPEHEDTIDIDLVPITPNATSENGVVFLKGLLEFSAVAVDNCPANAYIRMRVTPMPEFGCFGIVLRATPNYSDGYELRFNTPERTAELRRVTDPSASSDGHFTLQRLEGLEPHFDLEIILYDDIIDVCIDHRRTLIRRCGDHPGNTLMLTARDASIVFADIQVCPLT